MTDEEHRHRCLARYVIRWRIKDRDAAHRWLKGYTNEAGGYIKGWNELHPESTLEADIKKQWVLGNRGEDGKWLN